MNPNDFGDTLTFAPAMSMVWTKTVEAVIIQPNSKWVCRDEFRVKIKEQCLPS